MEHNPENTLNQLPYDLLNDMYAQRQSGLFIVKTANEWLQQASLRPVPKMLFSELWHEGELCILFADTNTGKSILAVQIADSISRGVPITGFKLTAKAQPVVYFDFELFDKQFEARYSINYAQHYSFSPNLRRAEMNPDNEVPDGYTHFDDYLHDSIEGAVMRTGAKILVIDNITYLRQETEKAKDALPLMKHLKALKQQYGLSILALAHTPKRDMTKPLNRNDLQGSKMLMNFCDSSFCIGESSTGNGMRYIKQIKARNTEIVYHDKNTILCRIDKPDNFLQFTHTGYGSEYDHLKTGEERDREWLIQRSKELHDEGMTVREIAEELRIGKSSVSNYINAA